MSNQPAVFDTFDIVRTYKASPERVFAACADPVKKRRWFFEGENWNIDSIEMDFREGGYERSSFRFKDGPVITNDTVFHDIVPNRRIVSSYDMTMAGRRFSVSLATLELEPMPSGSGTRLRYTEQAAFFGDADGAKLRREGCAELLEKLATELGE